MTAVDGEKILFVFPGQGSQYPGMGEDLHGAFASVREIYARASAALGRDVAEISFGGGEIHRTKFTQPALLTHSMACLAALAECRGEVCAAHCAAGHSLGEYSALAAADSLDFAGALRLVQKRGELMGEHGEGEMTALPLDVESARALADQYFCAVAGCNLGDQTVVGGRAEDLEALERGMQELYPRKRFARLKTEGAFHTHYMVKAAREFRAVLAAADVRPPKIGVLSNYTGGFHGGDAELIKPRLFFQLFHPVRWHANLQTAAAAGVTRIVEFGGGIGSGATAAEKRPNLEGIIKKTFRRGENPPAYHAVINLETVHATAEALGRR